MTHILRKLALGSALAFSLATSALAGTEVNVTPTGLALRGNDPVAYFTVGKPTLGDFEITSEYEGATYRFASAENKALFDADPAKYAPQYGGYCAFGTAFGKKFDGDPNVWKIVDDKLYLNLAPAIQARWNEKTAELIEQANTEWPSIKDDAPEALLAE